MPSLPFFFIFKRIENMKRRKNASIVFVARKTLYLECFVRAFYLPGKQKMEELCFSSFLCYRA